MFLFIGRNKYFRLLDPVISPAVPICSFQIAAIFNSMFEEQSIARNIVNKLNTTIEFEGLSQIMKRIKKVIKALCKLSHHRCKSTLEFVASAFEVISFNLNFSSKIFFTIG